MFDTVMTALRGGDFAAAAAAARAVLAQQPDSAQAHHLLGLALRQQGDLAAADAAFDRALALAPEQAAFHLSRGLLAVQRQDPEAARAALGEALKHDPNQLMAYVTLAELSLSSGDLAQADQQLKFAERIAAEHPHVLVLRAQWQNASGQGEAALRTLQHAAENKPDDALVVGALGLAYLNRRHFAFAEQSLRKALTQQPQAQELRYALVHALLAQGRHEDAAQEAEALLAGGRETPRALTLKGQIAADRGLLDVSIAALTRSLQLDPAQPHALDALLGGYMQRGEQAQARAALEALLVQRPQLDFIWSALVSLLRSDVAAAAAAAARWCEARPDSAQANEVAAQLSESTGDFVAAKKYATAAVQRHASSIGAQLVLARTELREGQPDAARARLAPLFLASGEAALRVVCAGWLGRACDAGGRQAEGVTAWTHMHALHAAAPALPPVVVAAPTAQADAPVLLWGPPGSAVELVADAMGSNLPATGLHWLPQLEAGVTGSRLIVVLGDPRDLLLNWLAFGAPQGWSAADPLAAAQFLAQTLQQFEALRRDSALPIHLVRAEELATAPERVAAELSAFLALPTPLQPDALIAPIREGFSNAFAPGHAAQYADALREAFAQFR